MICCGTDFPFSFTGMIAAGMKSTFKLCPRVFNQQYMSNNLMPPPVEPALPPINIRRELVSKTKCASLNN